MAMLPDDQRGQQRMLGILLLVGLAGAYYMYMYTPRSAELTEMEDRIAQLELDNERAEARIGDLDQVRAELEQMERLFGSLQELVPDRAEATRLYESIATRSQDLGLELVSVVPASPRPTEDGYYLRQSWNLTLEGEYHTLGRFLTEVASFERLVRPQLQSLQPVGGGEGARDVRATLRLETFVLPPDSAQDGEQGGGAGAT